MRKCLTKFSRIVECGAVQKCKKCVNFVDLVKSFLFFARIGRTIFKSFQTNICLQTSASIQPRTGLSNFAKNLPNVILKNLLYELRDLVLESSSLRCSPWQSIKLWSNLWVHAWKEDLKTCFRLFDVFRCIPRMVFWANRLRLAQDPILHYCIACVIMRRSSLWFEHLRYARSGVDLMKHRRTYDTFETRDPLWFPLERQLEQYDLFNMATVSLWSSF